MSVIANSLKALAVLGLLSIASSTPGRAETDPLGKWTMGKVTVNVTNCGNTLCAQIIGLAEPISKIDGKPKVDRENPDPGKRKRPLIGLTVMSGMVPAGDNKWKGTIYNADDGNTYNATMRLSGEEMKVQGCVAAILCKTNTFTRVP